MATHYLARHSVGPLDENAVTQSYIVDEASVPMWGPIGPVTAGSGEYIARVSPTATEGDPMVLGVVCGPLKDAANLYASTAAGQAIVVCTFGKCKLKVDGTDNIAIGDALCSHDTNGEAQLVKIDAETGDSVTSAGQQALYALMASAFAMALYASTADGDIIAVTVYGARGTQT